MSDYWKLFLDTFSEHISMFPDSEIHYKNGIKIMNGNAGSYMTNIMALNSIDLNKDVDFVKNKFKTPGIIFSQSYQIAPDLLAIFYDRLSYIGEFPVMERRESNDYYSAPHYDNISIENNHYNPLIIKDFTSLSLETKGIPNNDFVVSEKDNIHIFVCYASDKPIGYLYAISSEDRAFVVEAYVRDGYRNSGILTALAKHAKEYVVSHGIYNFYSIATSEYTVMTTKQEGHQMIGSLYIWLVSE